MLQLESYKATDIVENHRIFSDLSPSLYIIFVSFFTLFVSFMCLPDVYK